MTGVTYVRHALVLVTLLAACVGPAATPVATPRPPATPTPTTPTPAPTASPSPTASPTPVAGRKLGPTEAERLVGSRDREALAALRDRNGTALAALAHPEKGVRFHPYPYADLARAVVLSPAQLRGAFTDGRKRTWGSQDGSGFPITLTYADYHQRYVYDRDFAAAPDVAFNRVLGMGNAIDNSAEAYPDAVLVEHHFPGADPRYGGLDWRALRLLFEQKDGAWHLVAVIHGEWTI